MKRSEVNEIIMDFENFLAEHKFMLPVWASWGPEDWKGKYDSCSEIIDNKLGWDITDFGSRNFSSRGLSLFTIRNGNWDKKDKMYCEKIMVADEEQETPMHYHWSKMEDIINRGGGNLVIELYNSTEGSKTTTTPVHFKIDGISHSVPAGGKVILSPGESICLEQGMFHRFYGEPGKGKVLVGEVSMVNDDTSDNCFLEQIGRFPVIDEDVPPLHLLVSDYQKFLQV